MLGGFPSFGVCLQLLQERDTLLSSARLNSIVAPALMHPSMALPTPDASLSHMVYGAALRRVGVTDQLRRHEEATLEPTNEVSV